MRVFSIVITTLALISGNPALGQDTPRLRALQTADDGRDWQAIGRLDTGTGFCTATLIAPDLVLTAAHCLYGATSQTRRADRDFTFQAGLRNGHPTAQRGIRRSLVHPGYTYDASVQLDRVRNDIALLQLDRAIPEQMIAPMATHGGVATGDMVQVVSYGQDREDTASLEEDCQVLADDSGVLVLSCDVVQGASGSPIMVARDGVINVVSVVSAQASWRGADVALSAELEGELVVLLDMLERGTVQSARGLPQVRTLTGGHDGRSSIGARFLRP